VDTEEGGKKEEGQVAQCNTVTDEHLSWELHLSTIFYKLSTISALTRASFQALR